MWLKVLLEEFMDVAQSEQTSRTVRIICTIFVSLVLILGIACLFLLAFLIEEAGLFRRAVSLILGIGILGVEMHPDTDQFIRVENGQALVCVGNRKETLDFQCCLKTGDGIFVPAGSWHNICNTGDCPLKLSSIYAPPHHPKGTVHCTKADAVSKD